MSSAVDRIGEVDLRQLFVDRFSELVSGSAIEARDDADILKTQARSGNPFPFIAYQWPSLLITDPNEARYFKGTIGDPDAPCLRLDDWQREDVLRPLFDEQYFSIVVKGNTKAGKGTAVAIGINVWFDVYDPCKVVLTSQKAEHAQHVLFFEVAKWRKAMRSPAKCRLLTNGISDHEQHYLAISNPLTGEGFSGQHGPRTLFVVDEATSVADERFDDAEKQARKIIALANPRTLSGWVYRSYGDCSPRDVTQDVVTAFGKRRCVTVSGADCMNVKHRRLEKPVSPYGGIEINGTFYPEAEPITEADYKHVKTLIPEQCDYGRYMGICQHPDPRHVDVFAHGKFPTEDPEKQVILPSWIDRHNKAWQAVRVAKGVIPVNCYAFDAARSLDGDASELAAGSEFGCAWLEGWKYNDITYHVQHIIDVVKNRDRIDLTKGKNPVCVDMVGLGSGVGDGLAAKGVWVIEYRGNDRSEEDPRTYANLRAESYAMLGRRLNPDDQWKDKPWPLPFDAELIEELCAPEKIYEGKDALRFRLQPKDEIKLKLGRSPDKGDALVQLYHAVRIYGALMRHRGSLDGHSFVHWPPPPKETAGTHLEPEVHGEKWWNS